MKIDSQIRLLLNGIWPSVRRDLARLGTDAEQEHAVRFLRKRLGTGSMIGLIPLLLLFTCEASGLLADHFGMSTLALALSWLISNFVFFLFFAIIGGMLLRPIWIWHRRTKAHRLLRWHLNQMGIAVCMECGYDLRSLLSERCPECGCARFTGSMSHSGLRE